MVCVFRGSVCSWLTVLQAPVNLCAAILDGDGRTLDPVEDSTHQGCALMGMADPTGNHCRVCVDFTVIPSTTDRI
jgi:hypothetical protein